MSMLTKLYLLLVTIFVTLTGFTVTAHAANALDPAGGGLGFDAAKAVYDAFAGGHYAYAAAMALVLAVAVLRKYGGSVWPSLHTDAGSALLVLGGSFGTALAASFAGGGPVSWPLVWSAATVAFAAAGGYTAVKKLIVEPLAPKLPPKLAAVLLWLFSHASDTDKQAPEGNTGN